MDTIYCTLEEFKDFTITEGKIEEIQEKFEAQAKEILIRNGYLTAAQARQILDELLGIERDPIYYEGIFQDIGWPVEVLYE